MDDFLPNMFESLQEIDQAKEKKKNHGTSFFAEALIPVNPVYWPAYYAGSAFRDEGPELNDKLNRFASNLERMEDYLVTSKSDVQYRDRAWTVAGHTAKVNLMCEVYGQLSAFVSGHYANKIADNYTDEIIEVDADLTFIEKANLELFKSVAKDKGFDPDEVRGTGLFREFVPDFMKEDMCNQPKRFARPADTTDDVKWADIDSVFEYKFSQLFPKRIRSLFDIELKEQASQPPLSILNDCTAGAGEGETLAPAVAVESVDIDKPLEDSKSIMQRFCDAFSEGFGAGSSAESGAVEQCAIEPSGVQPAYDGIEPIKSESNDMCFKPEYDNMTPLSAE